jgi:transcriptional regulator with XRE-family HTH domain
MGVPLPGRVSTPTQTEAMDAGRVILEARLRAGLTQEEVAHRTGMAIPAVSRLERGLVRPRVDTLERILTACGYSLQVERRLGAAIDREPIRRSLERPHHARIPRWLGRSLRLLRGHRVRSLIVGTTAARLHGAPIRVTWLEILPSPDPPNCQRLRLALRQLRVRTSRRPPPLRWRGRQYVKLDRGGVAIWWPRRDLPSFEELRRPAQPVAIQGFEIWWPASTI